MNKNIKIQEHIYSNISTFRAEEDIQAEEVSYVIFTETSEGTVAPNELLRNKIAYANGGKIIGTRNTCTITGDIVNGTLSGAAKTYIEAPHTQAIATVTIVPDENCRLPQTINVTNAEYTYDNNTGIVEITHAISHVIVHAYCTEPK